MTRTPSQHETAALAVLTAHGIHVSLERAVPPRCPEWGITTPRTTGCPNKCGQIHGDHYRVTVASTRRAYTFDFWGSYAGSRIEAHTTHAPYAGRTLGYTPAEVIDCLLSDAQSEQTADEVYDEMGGGMRPSQCEAVADHGRRLREVLPADVIDAAWAALNGEEAAS